MGEEIIAIAESEEDVNAFVAIECGKVIAEYGEHDTTGNCRERESDLTHRDFRRCMAR